MATAKDHRGRGKTSAGTRGRDVADVKAELRGLQQDFAIGIAQVVLDLAGFSPDPVVGLGADIVSGATALYERQWLDAGLSAISLIPGADLVTKYPKITRNINRLKKIAGKIDDLKGTSDAARDVRAVSRKFEEIRSARRMRR